VANGINAHRVLKGTASKNGFLDRIDAPESVEDGLRAARDRIRSALRDAARSWQQFVKREELLEKAVAGGVMPSFSPKFRMQGSFAYRTLNDPPQKPPQQLDLDDGMFLPVSFFQANGGLHPAIASRGLFLLVERALQPLCDDQGWELDRSKPSCVRVKLALRTHAHIDIALYSIPDEQFVQLSESVLAKHAQDERIRLSGMLDLDEEVYRAIASEQILLAHREENWKPSDPRKLEVWFESAIKRHGYVARRVSRYLKAWRDFQWPSCGLSSITLMSCVVATLDALGKSVQDERDDLTLEVVARELSNQLRRPIENPVVKGQYLDDTWTDEMRRDFCSRASLLASACSSALRASRTAEDVLAAYRSVLGPRVPADTALVSIEEEVPTRTEISSAPAVLTSGLLRERGQETTTRQPVQKAGDRRYA